MAKLLIGDPNKTPITQGLVDTPDSELAPVGSASVCRNIVFDNGMIGSRGGIQVVGAVGSAGKISGLHSASLKDGTKVLLRTYDTELERYNTTTEAWVNISSALTRSEEHTSELQSRENLVCRLLL